MPFSSKTGPGMPLAAPQAAAGNRHRSRFAASCVALAVAVVAGGCELLGGAPRRPNILLVSIDTLRADRLGAYGSGIRPSPSPTIDALAASGIVVEQAVSSASETAPAVATLMTGLYQDRHRVDYNRATLDIAQRTLAERLTDAGYESVAFIANALIDGQHGFGQGFSRMEVVASKPMVVPSTDDRLVAGVAEWLAAPPTDKPWFLWVHMMDPHGPYSSAPESWSRDFDYSAAPALPSTEPPISDSNFGLGVIPAYQKLPGLVRLADYVRRYDGEIHFTDAQLGVVLAKLGASGHQDDTIVVVVADHGESLVEHDELLQHGWFVYDQTVRVPLVVAWPSKIAAGRRHAAQVCTVDIVPTLLELAGVADDAEPGDGVSFAAALVGDRAAATPEAAPRDCFSIGSRANHPFALRTGTSKFILTPAGAPVDPKAPKGERSTLPERRELYDLVKDPGETRDLMTSKPSLAEDFEHRLAAFRARCRANGLRW